jgi:hypothetical protein
MGEFYTYLRNSRNSVPLRSRLYSRALLRFLRDFGLLHMPIPKPSLLGGLKVGR